MYKAVEAHDYETFTRYVDVDSVIDNVVDKALKETEEEASVEGDVWAEFGKSLAEGFIALMKPRLKEEAKSQIRKQIESGEFKKNYQPKNLVNAITKIKVKKEGKVADVVLMNEENKELSLKMRKMDRYWQVFDMDFELGEESKTSGESQQLKFGEKTDIGEGWFLTIQEPELYESSDIWESAKEGYKLVSTEITYENTSEKTDSFSLSNLKVKDTQNHSYSDYLFGGKEPALESGDLEPKGTVKGFVTFEILEDAEVQSVIYTGSYKTIIFSK